MNYRMNISRALAGPVLALAIALAPAAADAQRTDLVYQDMPDRPGSTPTLTVPVSTGFGTYIPYRVPKYTATIGNAEATLRSDFSNVRVPQNGFAWDRYFDATQRAALKSDRMTLRPEGMGSFAQAYAGMNGPDFAPFITTDAALSGLRVTAEEAYRSVQMNQLRPDLQNVLDQIGSNLNGLTSNGSDQGLAQSALRMLAWVETGRALLNPSATIDGRVESEVRNEIDRINAARAARSSILFNRQFDYSLFAEVDPTLPSQLANYRRAAIWLSEAGIRMGSSMDEARAGALLAKVVDGLDQTDRQGLEDIVEIEAFFGGRNDRNLSTGAVAAAMQGWFGFQYGSTNSFLTDNSSMERLVEYLQQNSGNADRSLNVVLLPQHQSLDETLFATLRQRGTSRDFGTQVVRAMQSGTATGLAATFSQLPAEEWARSYDWVSLYTASIMATFQPTTRGYPLFMQSDAWKGRTSESALGVLGSVANESGVLQSGNTGRATRAATLVARSYDVVGYVEPDPEAWGAIASQARYLRDGLVDGVRGRIVDSGIEEKLRDLENLSAQYMKIAALELQGRPLETADETYIQSGPEHIAAWETYVNPALHANGALLTASAPAVAGKEGAALGHPVAIYVLAPSANGEPMLVRGAVYNYEETTQSGSDWIRTLTSAQGSMENGVVPVSQIRPVEGSIRAATPALQKQRGGGLADSRAEIELEANVVRRSSGALWYTVKAPGYNGADVVTTVVNSAGQKEFESYPHRIESGERYDMVPVDELNSGQYFIRVSDVTGRVLASGRFAVVR